MKTRKAFDINRVREFCKLVNEGKQPKEALLVMRSCAGYEQPLKSAGLFWKEKDGTYKAVERIYAERYELFISEKRKYIRKRNEKQYAKQKEYRSGFNKYVKQNTLFNQPKTKTPDAWTQSVKTQSVKTQSVKTQSVKAKTKQFSFVQRVVKSLFNL